MPTLIKRSAIHEDLLEALRAQVIETKKSGTPIGSEHEISRQWHLSRHAVRKAIDQLVREGLVQRQPGRGLFTSASAVRTIQVVAGKLAWETMGWLTTGIQDLAKERGVRIQTYDAHGSFEADIAAIQNLPESDAVGALIVSLHNRCFGEALFDLKRKGFPFVVVDDILSELNAPTVCTDNYAGGNMAGRELLALGHRRIGFMGDLVARTVQARLEGLRDAINDAGVAFDRSLIRDVKEENNRLGDWSKDVATCARELLGRADRPTAIFCSCDAIAASLYPVARDMKLQIGRDISLVGFDDASFCTLLDPPLATVRQPMAEVGKVALGVLLNLLQQPGGFFEARMVPVEWVPRTSVGPRFAGRPHPLINAPG